MRLQWISLQVQSQFGIPVQEGHWSAATEDERPAATIIANIKTHTIGMDFGLRSIIASFLEKRLQTSLRLVTVKSHSPTVLNEAQLLNPFSCLKRLDTRQRFHLARRSAKTRITVKSTRAIVAIIPARDRYLLRARRSLSERTASNIVKTDTSTTLPSKSTRRQILQEADVLSFRNISFLRLW